MSTSFKTLRQYMYPEDGHKKFIIPTYQRGYKWSVRLGDEQTSVEYLLQNLLSSYETNSKQQYFLQGVTVVEDGENIILIDGQQRTTTLYILLWCLNREYIKNIDLDYTIRKRSGIYLNRLKDTTFDYSTEDQDNRIQDIYYFKEAINQINDLLPQKLNKRNFAEFLLDKISLLYIVIDRDKAVRTFTMMNGQKATMHDEELIKADMLHIVSQSTQITNVPELKTLDDTFSIFQEIISTEWETNALRSKYAREWDKWLYWWNDEEVRKYFMVHNPMGLLLEYYFRKVRNNDYFSFRNFKALLPDNDKKRAKDVFKGLRDLQKDFEDIYNDAKTYNYLKCALIGSSGDAEDKFNIIMYYITNKRNYKNQRYYALWRLLGSTHIEITEEYTNNPTAKDGKISNTEIRENRAKTMIKALSNAIVYGKNDDVLYKQLLRLNVEEYNKLKLEEGIKFDFSIWNNKSLEHIYPKSKFYHTEELEDGTIICKRGDGMEISAHEASLLIDTNKAFTNTSRYSEHCIGNLVLLYGRNNSEFGNLLPEEKKAKFFNNERSFESRNLLHTISAFANSEWGPEEIEKASDKIIERIKKDYSIA